MKLKIEDNNFLYNECIDISKKLNVFISENRKLNLELIKYMFVSKLVETSNKTAVNKVVCDLFDKELYFVYTPDSIDEIKFRINMPFNSRFGIVYPETCFNENQSYYYIKDKFYMADNDRYRAYVFPEDGLHPQRQISKISEIVEYINTYDARVDICTNSPYILTMLNCCLKASYLYDKYKDDDVFDVLSEKCHINKNDANVFEIKNHELFDLFNVDGESDVILCEAIDIASDGIRNLFDKLIDIEIKHEGMIE